jgi:hypothetical protein
MYHREAKSFPCAISTYGIPVTDLLGGDFSQLDDGMGMKEEAEVEG